MVVFLSSMQNILGIPIDQLNDWLDFFPLQQKHTTTTIKNRSSVLKGNTIFLVNFTFLLVTVFLCFAVGCFDLFAIGVHY